jgi:MFS transporter, DHA2 family, methylenomycin A resistance protein
MSLRLPPLRSPRRATAVLPPPTAAPARRPHIALLGIALGYFMVLLDTTVLSVAEPDLAHSLGSSTAGLQWTVTGYTVTFGALLLSAGAAADRYGAHRLFRWGVAVFGAASLLSACAPDLWTLVLLRAVLGAAAAACVPSSMALITLLYPEPARRARAVAVWAAVSGAALAAGPPAGGLLVGLAGWRAVFLVNVPLAVLVRLLVAGPAVVCPAGERRTDRPPQLAACAALALCTDALIALGSRAWQHAAWSAAAALAVAAVFAALERRSASPVLERRVLRAPGMGPMLLAGAAVGFTLTGVLFVLPLLFQQRYGYGPLATGAAFLPMTLPTAVNPVLVTGRVVARYGPRGPILAGLCLLAAAGAGMGAALWTGAPYPVLAAGLLAAGFGVSLALPALTTAVITLAPAGTAGAAGGLLNAIRQAGATMGVAALGAFVRLRPDAAGRGDHGAGAALLLTTAVCAGAALTRRRSREPDRGPA